MIIERKKLDVKGRCCGRKPIYYKGGSWRSPPGSPMYFCVRCALDYGPDGYHRENSGTDTLILEKISNKRRC